MARTVGIGQQDFADIRREDLFYIDKTHFIKEWWDSKLIKAGKSPALITKNNKQCSFYLVMNSAKGFIPLIVDME